MDRRPAPTHTRDRRRSEGGRRPRWGVARHGRRRPRSRAPAPRRRAATGGRRLHRSAGPGQRSKRLRRRQPGRRHRRRGRASGQRGCGGGDHDRGGPPPGLVGRGPGRGVGRRSRCRPARDDLDQLLGEADATSIDWERHPAVPSPAGRRPRPARRRSPRPSAGWSASAPARPATGVGPSLRWMGEIALWGTELVAQGRMVPVLRGASSGRPPRPPGRPPDVTGCAGFRPWSGRDRLHDLVTRMPGRRWPPCSPRPRPTRCAGRSWPRVVDAISRAGRRPPGGAGRRSPRQHPHRDRRGRAVRPRRPALRGRLGPGRPGRRGPQAVGRARSPPTTASA